MTGPISVASSAGIADHQLAHGAVEHGEDAVGDVVLHEEHAQRRAALPGAVEGRGEHIGDDLLGQRR